MGQEKMQILKMVEEGKISAEEGMKLLQAIEDGELNFDKGSVRADVSSSEQKRRLRIRVVKQGKETVNIKIPLSLINVGLKIGKKFSPELQESMGDIDMDEVVRMIQEGAEGRLVEIEDGEDIVEVYVE